MGENDGEVTQCYSTGVVSAVDVVGGLVGDNYGAVTQCYSTGTVRGDSDVGGLVGSGSKLTQCYSTGSVSGKDYVGGLVGSGSNLTQCYSTGAVNGTGDNVGGLVGHSDQGTAIACLWDTETSGQTKSAGGTRKTTAEMQTAKTFLDAGWDWVGETKNGTSEIWQMPQGSGYPILAIFHGYTPPQLKGLGTPDDPYLISNALELGAMVCYSLSAHYRLVPEQANTPGLHGWRTRCSVSAYSLCLRRSAA